MRGVINFSKANCKNCYSCVRACPVHAVRVKDEQAEIIEERCIACGKCLRVCPKNAKEVKSEIKEVKKFLSGKNSVAVSLAPSFAAAFETSGGSMVSALKKLGFAYVEETAVGAAVVSKEFEKYSDLPEGRCYITSCCTAVNDLIQKHNPELIQSLIPVISPMVCHSRMMRQKYGSEIKVVFIGPCLAKKIEAEEEEAVDAVLTFDELYKWFKEEKTDLDQLEETPFDAVAKSARKYPIISGVSNTLDKDKIKREVIHVNGSEDCLAMLQAIKEGQFKNAFIEMNLCHHGCIDGPAMPENKGNVFERSQRVKKHADICENLNENSCKSKEIKVEVSRNFKSKCSPLKQPDENEIKEILSRIGKHNKLDELNCGTCGYKTCREKAAAVYNDMAELTMCLPYMKQKAENLSNVIFDVTPSIIIIVDKDFHIIDFNPSAEKLFNVSKNAVFGNSIKSFIDTDILLELAGTGKNIFGRKTILFKQDAVVLQSALWVQNHEAMLLIMHDITETERREEKLQNMKINAIEMAQRVIDKQMIVAQEIASLLGETTAETKVSLTKLKKLVQNEEGV